MSEQAGDFLHKVSIGRRHAWVRGRESYVCADGMVLEVSARALDANALVYEKNEQPGEHYIIIYISGVQFNREVDQILESPDSIRTIIFPETVRVVEQGAFFRNQALRSAVVNEGLETLGTDEYDSEGEMGGGVFEDSGLESIHLPSTLKRIEYCAFEDCRDLRNV